MRLRVAMIFRTPSPGLPSTFLYLVRPGEAPSLATLQKPGGQETGEMTSRDDIIVGMKNEIDKRLTGSWKARGTAASPEWREGGREGRDWLID